MRSFSESKRETCCLSPSSESPSATRSHCAASAFLTFTATSLARMQSHILTKRRNARKQLLAMRLHTTHDIRYATGTSNYNFHKFTVNSRQFAFNRKPT